MLIDAIRIATLAEVLSDEAMRRTGNAAGVQRADMLLPAGSYSRPPPRVVDMAALDGPQHEVLRGYLAETTQTYGPLQVVVLRDACVVGQGSVVTRDGALVRDSALEFLAHGRTPDGFARDADGTLRLASGTMRTIDGPALLLKRPWWRNYGHWLVDGAAILALAGGIALPRDWRIIVGAGGGAREIVAQSLAMLAPGVTVLEHADGECWRVGELIYVAPVHVPPLSKRPEALAALRALVLRDALRLPAASRRLFVSRGAHPARRLVNEAELVAVAAAAGYETVQPEQLDLPAQAALFRSASCIVGVKGAALANLMFCAAGAQVLVLSPGDFPDPFFWDLAAHAGAGYAELFGQLTARDARQGSNPFRIDPGRFADLLPL